MSRCPFVPLIVWLLARKLMHFIDQTAKTHTGRKCGPPWEEPGRSRHSDMLFSAESLSHHALVGTLLGLCCLNYRAVSTTSKAMKYRLNCIWNICIKSWSFIYNIFTRSSLEDAKILLKCYSNAKITDYIFCTNYHVANNKPLMFPSIYLISVTSSDLISKYIVLHWPIW